MLIHYRYIFDRQIGNAAGDQVNDRVYLATEEGDVVVVKTGSQFEVLATNTLTDHSFIASPIAIGNDLYLRGRTHLFRISER